MENREYSPSEIRELINKYESEMWITQYERHGIPEKYHKKWFIDYECENDEMLKTLERVKAISRINRPMALLGEVGNGKTHLACCILKDSIIFSKPEEDAGYYHTMTSLNRAFREALADGKESAFYEKIKKMKCLVIDEIQIKSDSESEQRMFQEIVDVRYTANKQTVFVGNVTKNGFKAIVGKRLADRLVEQDIQIMVFNNSSYRRKK